LHQFDWTPGIGDPTFAGWLTVGLYCLAAISTWLTANSASIDRGLWRAICIAFVALGVNKQLDLQTVLTDLGRVIATSQGWYEQRQAVQFWFIIGVGVICLVLGLILLVMARRAPLPTWVALVGMTLVLAFVAARAASFHHFDRFIGTRLLGLKWNWVLEMGGISVVLIASEWRRRLSSNLDP
jgi:uncharacterized membrane protein YbhN (UPF0104 family)